MVRRRKSYTAAYKFRVVKYSDDRGVLEASCHFAINDRLIRKWRNNRDLLIAAKPMRRANRSPNAMYPELEKELKKWILEERAVKRSVSTVRIRTQAILMGKEKGYAGFTASPNWCYKFMKRNGLSVRATTSTGQHLPEDYIRKREDFRNFVFDETMEVQPGDWGNMDEVPVSFDMPRRFTVDEKGKEDIFITTTGSEKNSFTVVLAVASNGSKCLPFIIFKRKTVPKGLPQGVVVRANEKGWMTEKLMADWVEKCWESRPNPCQDPEKSLLILDSARSHLTAEAKEAVKKRTKIAVIPGGMTKLLQPLDIAVNKSFKANLNKKWEDWISNSENHSFTKSGKLKRASYATVCTWIKESFDDVPISCIKNGLRKAMIDDPEIETGGYESPLVLYCSGKDYNYCHKPLLDFLKDYVFAPSYKLNTCVIPKSISTVMTAVICLLYDTEKFLANNKTINKEYYYYRFCAGLNEARSMDAIKAKKRSNYTDENAHLWTHMVVVREPMERFVSGFLNKCRVEKTWLKNKRICFGCKGNVSCFLKRLNRMMTYPSLLRQTFDTYHFAPQSWYCEMGKYMYNNYTIVRYSRSDPEGFWDQLSSVFRKVNVPEEKINIIHDQLMNGETKHSTFGLTDSKQKLLKELYEPENFKLFLKIYYYDYILFGFPLPDIK
ncbi:hypothetical protein FO519_008009 [Halicephalobus sp. NKZ332]|nr:hypothetical protein FO519_008009 [Halicephalobus sp. NKZ332]